MIEQQLKSEVDSVVVNDNENSIFNIGFILKSFILNWKWFLLSVVIFLGAAAIYIRYTSPVYQVKAKFLIKDDKSNGRSSAASQILSSSTLGTISGSDGFDNELEVLQSNSLAEEAMRDLKIYVNYYVEGRISKHPVYKTNPVNVDMDEKNLMNLKRSIQVTVENEDGNLEVEIIGQTGKKIFSEQGVKLPKTIRTSEGTIYLSKNPLASSWDDNHTMVAVIKNPAISVRQNFVDVSALSKTTTIAVLTYKDILPERASDFLQQLAVVYNRQANEDKNIIAMRTEEFINQRLEKINEELGSTDGAIANYKRSNSVVDVTANASMSLTESNAAEKQLMDMNTQIALMQSLEEYMQQPTNKYQTLPANVGLKDNGAVELISKYNQLALERNRLLHSASEQSPMVKTVTSELDDLIGSIRGAVQQSKSSLTIQRRDLLSRVGKYTGQLSQTPQQERFLTEIGRQQTVKSSLYIMLLEKREENSITLAATSDKGKLIDVPENYGVVKPQKSILLLIALLLGLALPMAVIIIIELMRFRIEGHEDVERLTKLPIVADIATAADAAGEIVVHENQNNQMEEIFRGMRTNVQFMLKENQHVIMFTSSISGEGKTFVAANLAVSFALLGKKTIVVGLDIRRPRLLKVFGKSDSMGVTSLLVREHPTKEQVLAECVKSRINSNLDFLPAGSVPPNPAELISRSSLDDIFSILREEYDYIIVDTAPVGLVSDTLLISRIADITCVVVRADYTEKVALSSINELASEGKLPNPCVVINGIDMTRKKYGYAYGYGKYGKYGKYGSNRYGSVGSYGYNSYSSSEDIKG